MEAAGVTVVGGGLAGAEAAWWCARHGVPATLYEMRPAVATPAHRSELLAELVCSNSLKSDVEGTAPALLKEEMARFGSVTLDAAARSRIPAGGALAVDRDRFARHVTAALSAEPLLRVVREEVTSLPPAPTVVATGPLTSAALAAELAAAIGRDNLFFFDALAPIVAAESVDGDRAFFASRYGKGEGGYVNCPLTAPEYAAFVAALAGAETAPCRDFERGLLFEGCLPVEELARRGPETVRFGPLKPVGLTDPRTGQGPYAVLQLRAEDDAADMFGLVGCQTRLTYAEQRRVFRMVPALARAEFLRYGAVHRNTYIAAPAALTPALELRAAPGVFIAGQLSGVEGYMESAAMGILAGMNAARRLAGREPVTPPRETAMGALCHYLTACAPDRFAPMNVNFGLFPSGPGRNRDERRRALVARAREAFAAWQRTMHEAGDAA